MAIIRLGGSAESDTGGFMLPVAGAIGVYFTNSSQTKLTNNFAKNELSATIVKTLSPTADYTEMGLDSGYVQTNNIETPELTLFAIYQQPTTFATSGAMIVSTFNGDPTSYGAGIYATVTGVTFAASQNLSGKTSGGIPVAATGWTLVVGKAVSGENTVQNLTNNAIKNKSFESRLLGSNPAPFRIGASYSTEYKDKAKIMAVVVFDRALADSEIDSVANVLRRYAAKHGVTV